MERDLRVNDVVQHFKRETVKNKNLYLYRIIGFAKHTETGERLVVYQALYSSPDMGVKLFDTFCRPYDMFMSEVDHKKYPGIQQKYRFEKVNRE